MILTNKFSIIFWLVQVNIVRTAPSDSLPFSHSLCTISDPQTPIENLPTLIWIDRDTYVSYSKVCNNWARSSRIATRTPGPQKWYKTRQGRVQEKPFLTQYPIIVSGSKTFRNRCFKVRTTGIAILYIIVAFNQSISGYRCVILPIKVLRRCS